MPRAFRTLRLLALITLTASCAGSEYRARLTFDAGVDPGSVRFIELLLLTSCPSPASVASGERPSGAIIAELGLSQADAASLPALGTLEPGAYGLHARGFDASCDVVAAGCADITLERGGDGVLLAELAATTAAVAACAADATCVDGECVGPAPTSTCTLEPSADGFASTYAAEGASGTDPTMSTFDGDGTSRMYSFVKFDLTGACQESGTIPSGAVVTDATLSLTLEDNCTFCDHTHELRLVTQPWSQDSFAGTDAGPGVAATASTTFEAPTAGTVLVTGLAGDVQTFLDAPATNEGWRIAQTANTGASAAAPFRWVTLEGVVGSRPRLVVTYGSP